MADPVENFSWVEFKALAEKIMTNTQTLRTEFDANKGVEDSRFKEIEARINTEFTSLKEMVNKLGETKVISGLPGSTQNLPPDQKAMQRKAAQEKFLRTGDAAELKALGETTDPQGGYLVTIDFRNQIVQKLPGLTAIRRRAFVFPTSATEVSVPKITGGDDVNPSDVTVTWMGGDDGNSTAGSTQPNFGSEIMPVNTVMATVALGNDLLEDAVFPLESILTTKVAQAFGLDEDNQFLNGSGIKKPKGILTEGGITTVNSGNASALTDNGLVDLVFSLPAQYLPNAAFIMKRATEGAARKLKDSYGRYLWGWDLVPGSPAKLLGYDVLDDEYMPAIAAGKIPILFGDLSYYWIAERLEMTVQVLRETKAKQNQTEFVFRRRIGGQAVGNFSLRSQTISA